MGCRAAVLASCRAQGYQVGVATNKAWTAASLRTSTLELVNESQAGKPMSGSWSRMAGPATLRAAASVAELRPDLEVPLVR